MITYSKERKAAILNKMLPPLNMSIAELSAEEGISDKTLYNWRKQLQHEGHLMPGKKPTAECWSPETKFAALVATASLSAAEVSQYCREKGLHVNQLTHWKETCLSGFNASGKNSKHSKENQHNAKADKIKLKKLEKELRYKDKALAETTALLVLRKKLHALWENGQEES